MSFSDEDLERLKDQLEANKPEDNWTPLEKMKALLARLDASESVCEVGEKIMRNALICEANRNEIDIKKSIADELRDTLNAWNDEAGRG